MTNSDSTFDVQMRMMSQVSNAVEVTILPPYVPSEEERASPALYAQNVQALFCKALGLSAVGQVRNALSSITREIPCSTLRSAAFTRTVVSPLPRPQDSHLTEFDFLHCLVPQILLSTIKTHLAGQRGWCALALSSNRWTPCGALKDLPGH